MRRKSIIAIISFALLFAIGCSNGSSIPTAPNAGNNDLAGSRISDSGTNTYLWGYYDISIDIPTKTVEAVPNRTVMFAVNPVEFLNQNPATLGFNIHKTPFGPDYIDVDIDVSLTHPFANLPQYNGYDVCGIFIGDGSQSLDYQSINVTDLADDQYMLNDPEDSDGGGPDGYTRWWNPQEFLVEGIFGYTQGALATPAYKATGQANPYKFFADGLGPQDDAYEFLTSTTNDAVFSSGATNTRNYYIRFPNLKGVTYSYAVLANWEGTGPESHPSRSIEARAVSVTMTESLYYTNGTNNGGNLILDIDVPGSEYQPSNILIESSVLLGLHTFDASSILTGGTENYSSYSVDIPADNLTSSGGNEFWVILEYTADYSNEFGVPNSAEEDPLASYFRTSEKDGLVEIVSVIPPVPPTSNIPLRPDADGLDLAVNHNNGDLLILYDDGEVWIYQEATSYNIGNELFSVMAGADRIDIAPNNTVIIGGNLNASINYCQSFDSVGNPIALHIVPAGTGLKDVMGSTSTIFNNYHVMVTGTGVPGSTRVERFIPPSYISSYVATSPDGLGAGQIDYDLIIGCESSDSSNWIWILEDDPEFRVERYSLDLSYTGLSIGGSKQNGMGGFWDPRDLTRSSDGNIHVLDKLGSGSPRIKRYLPAGNGHGQYADGASISGDPLRIEGSDYNGNIFVLHTEGLSIFFPADMPG